VKKGKDIVLDEKVFRFLGSVLVRTEETPVLRPASGGWRPTFHAAAAAVMQSVAERQTLDNPAVIAASCLLDGISALLARGTPDRTGPLGRKELRFTRARRTVMPNTPVKELMEERIIMVPPESTLYEAARKMQETGCGCLLVGVGNKPDGVITDRDIVVRALARGGDPALEKVADHMTSDLVTCAAADTLAQAAEAMREHSVSRMVVTDGDGHAVGILSFGRLLRNHDDPEEVTQIVACATGHKNIFDARKSLSDAALGTH
jgi:CBS domain-containing protein